MPTPQRTQPLRNTAHCIVPKLNGLDTKSLRISDDDDDGGDDGGDDDDEDEDPYQIPIRFLTGSYHIPIIFLSYPYQPTIIFVSDSHQTPFRSLSYSYQIPIRLLSASYQIPIIFLNFISVLKRPPPSYYGGGVWCTGCFKPAVECPSGSLKHVLLIERSS